MTNDNNSWDRFHETAAVDLSSGYGSCIQTINKINPNQLIYLGNSRLAEVKIYNHFQSFFKDCSINEIPIRVLPVEYLIDKRPQIHMKVAFRNTLDNIGYEFQEQFGGAHKEEFGNLFAQYKTKLNELFGNSQFYVVEGIERAIAASLAQCEIQYKLVEEITPILRPLTERIYTSFEVKNDNNDNDIKLSTKSIELIAKQWYERLSDFDKHKYKF